MGPEQKNQYTPDKVSPPGETLLDLLEEQDMSQADLAERMGLSKKTINEIVKGIAPITQETALALERVFRVPAAFWSSREQQYREFLARRDERTRLKEEIGWLRTLPVKRMIELGWIRAFQDKVTQLEEVLSFFGIASPKQYQTQIDNLRPAFRRSKVFRGDQSATAAWLRRGEILARNVECAPFDAGKFREALVSARAMTTASAESFLPELVSLCASAGVAVVIIPELPRTYVCGATRWLNPAKALIQLSTRYKTNDHFWFTFFHESGHVLKHGKREVFVDEKCGIADEDEDAMEQEADRFARDLLISPAEWKRFLAQGTYAKDAIRKFASEIGVAPGIVVGRFQHDGGIPHHFCNDLKEKLIWHDI